MDPILQKIIEQVPSLSVLVWVVVYFLRHMKDVVQMAIDGLHDVFERNTTALDRNTEQLGKSVYVIDRENAAQQQNEKVRHVRE